MKLGIRTNRNVSVLLLLLAAFRARRAVLAIVEFRRSGFTEAVVAPPVLLRDLRALAGSLTSGVTSKPAKGPAPWTTLFSLPADGLATPFLARPMPVLQDAIPVLPLLPREVRFENQAPFRSDGHVRHDLTNPASQPASRRISIER